MTLIVTGVFFLGDPRLPGAETHPTAAPPHRLGRAGRARIPLPSSAPRNSPTAPTPPAVVRHRLADATRGCVAASAGSLPLEAQASGTAARPPTKPNSGAAVSRPGWRRSSPGPPDIPTRTAGGIHSGASGAPPARRVPTPALSRPAAAPFSCP